MQCRHYNLHPIHLPFPFSVHSWQSWQLKWMKVGRAWLHQSIFCSASLILLNLSTSSCALPWGWADCPLVHSSSHSLLVASTNCCSTPRWLTMPLIPTLLSALGSKIPVLLRHLNSLLWLYSHLPHLSWDQLAWWGLLCSPPVTWLQGRVWKGPCPSISVTLLNCCGDSLAPGADLISCSVRSDKVQIPISCMNLQENTSAWVTTAEGILNTFHTRLAIYTSNALHILKKH